MSADLFTEFGGGAKDLLENPWAQIASRSPYGESGEHVKLRRDSQDLVQGVLPPHGVTGQSTHVLFDAEEDDDFGNFERPLSPPSLDPDLAKRDVYHDLLNPTAPESTTHKSISDSVAENANSIADLENLETLSLKRSKQTSSSKQADPAPQGHATLPNTLVSDVNSGDGWGDFVNESVEPTNEPGIHDNIREDQVVEKSAPASIYSLSQGPPGVHSKLGREAPSVSRASSGNSSKEAAPPNNVPPPSVLLTLAASLLSTLNSDLRRSIAETAAEQGPSTEINRLLCVPMVAARIIAGRKLRWKRDLNLSQSMKIGPASSGKTGGMKLAGVDKSESLGEEREVSEVVRIWRITVGPLRSMVSKISQQLSVGSPTVPDISEIMPVRIAKFNEGAITAPKSCFLCGLKREERVNALDGNVEDSFGEWWSDYWGHLTCRIFWEQYSGRLKQR